MKRLASRANSSATTFPRGRAYPMRPKGRGVAGPQTRKEARRGGARLPRGGVVQVELAVDRDLDDLQGRLQLPDDPQHHVGRLAGHAGHGRAAVLSALGPGWGGGVGAGGRVPPATAFGAERPDHPAGAYLDGSAGRGEERAWLSRG